MNASRFRAAALTALFVPLAAALVSAQSAPAGRETTAESVAGYSLSQTMPVDPEVLVGALPNGLRYYVRANGKPARQAELRLVVRAGSVLEDDDQRGVAHFVEHMEFEGTRHFPGQGIIQFLSALGPEYRSRRERGDELQRHSIHAAGADRCARCPRSRAVVLEDWAQGATFDQMRIERERGIVLVGVAHVPWRRGADAGQDAARAARRIALRRSARRLASPPSSSACSASSWCASIAIGTGPT